MNRLLCICVLWISQLMLYAQESYKLTLQSSPQQAGYFDYNTEQWLEKGTKLWLNTWNKNSGFVFERWEENGKSISKERSFYYEMPGYNATLTAVYRFDPTVPDNPVSPASKHWMTLVCEPSQAGYFNWGNRSKVVEGEQIDVWTNPNNNSYRFVEWRMNGETVSKDNFYVFTVPTTDFQLVAVYEFNPSTPGNPGRNYFANGEAIIDDFSDGLYNAIWQLVGGELDKINSLTVIGKLKSNDWYNTREMKNCTYVDLSRTTGLTDIPSWAFNYVQTLHELLLPASISSIGNGAFYECDSLQSLSLLAAVPPTVPGDAFYGIDTNYLTVYVPAASLALYRSANVWKDLNIQPLLSDVKSLEVNLPHDVNTSLYKGMYIELYNNQSGQTNRYVITDRVTYTFNSLMNNTEYTVSLKNSKGEVLGVIPNVQILDKDVRVTFKSLMVPRTVSLQVQTPDGTDVTDQVTITWMDAEGTYLSRGNQLAAQLDSTVLNYRITLPQALAMEYQLPEDLTYTVSEECNLSYQLKAIPLMTISGEVIENKYGDPLSRAAISVSQVFNGQYTKSYTTQAGRDGKWQLDVHQAPTEISASKVGYVTQTQKFDSLVANIPTFILEDISGTTISLNLTYTDVTGNTVNGYTDFINVAFSVYNETKKVQINDFSLQYPKIVLMDVNKGQKLRITATSKVNKFMPVEATTTVDNNDVASVTLNIKQLGGIKATYIRTDNTSIVGILYDANGRLVSKYDYKNSQLEINELIDGQYTLVTMAGSQFFNSIYSLSQFTNSGLREGIDFVKNKVKVESGKISTITNQIIPYLDETKLYYTSPKTSFTVNKSQVTAGQYLTLTAFIAFKNAYAAGVSDVKLIVDLPDSTKFVESSVMVGNAMAGYTYDETQHSVMIPVTNLNERIRFCIIPTKGGTYSPAAAVQFKFDGKTLTQPIGSVTYDVKDLSITVPEVVSKKSVPVSGTAIGKSNIKVYANNILLGQTTSLSNGAWATNIELLLEDENQPSSDTIYAVITTKENLVMQTESKVVTYNPQAVQVADVTMYYTNPEENWWRGKNYELVHNFLTPSVRPFRYVYYIYNRSFTFTINFTNNDPELITNVILEVKTGDGRWNTLVATYDARRKCWLAYGEFGNMYDGIVPVNVRVRFTFGGYVYIVPYPGPDADVPIDPSGYVYEAVPTNRIQGVTATIYYKETVEDNYGDIHENIVLWDAEEYAQQNPLFTDENGMYRWDVPQGLWQVKFEKEGYQTVYSEWLPVPPPQLDVNIAMTQLSQPTVKNAMAYEEGVEVEFDKFMDPATLNVANIQVTLNDSIVNGTVELLNEEAIGENAEQTYASKVRFLMPDSLQLTSTDEVVLTVSSSVKSYAGVPMAANYTQEFNVTPKVKTILVDSLMNIPYGEERTLVVAAQPADAAKGKKLLVRSLSKMIAEVSADTLLLNEEGHAKLTVKGDMPGSTVLTFEVDSTDLVKHTKVNVKEAELLKTVAPIASRVTGSEVYRNTKVLLSSDTEDATIRYTLDGTDPATSETVITYSDDQPIIITSDAVTIKAVAKGHDMELSEMVQFDYSLKQTNLNYQLPAGWSWISHNLEEPVAFSKLNADIECLKSQTKEVIKDPNVGLIGNLSELQPGEAYKVKVAEEAKASLKGYEFNASASAIPVYAGWNWLGYPVNQVMSVDEALAFYEANEGDMIVSLDGFAQFADGKWKGELGLKPGQGYLLKAVTSSDLVFNNTKVSNANSRIGKRNYLINSPWAPAKYAYPNVMPFTAELYANGEKVNADEYVVGAFSDTECRGVGQWLEGRLVMTVYGDRGEDIRFVAKHLTDDTYYDITEQLAFADDNVGTWHAPFALNIGGESTSVEELNSEFTVTPAIVRDHISVSASGRNISYVSLTNMGGRVVISVSDLGKGAIITTSQLPAGMYIVTVKADGQTFYKKIIKG